MTVDRRTRPFLTAGVTVLPADEVVPVLLHLAGGVDWWATRRTGVRFEVRERQDFAPTVFAAMSSA